MLGFLGGVGSVIAGASGEPGGAGGAGGLGGAAGGLDLDLSSRAESEAESEAVSGGTFSSGNISIGKSDTLVVAAVVVLSLLIVFWRKK